MVTDWQWHYLSEDYVESATNASTLRLKLPVREQISCIEIECRAEISTADYNHKVIDMLNKIEVIGDGSAVLYSMSPETAAFLHLIQIGNIPNLLNVDYAALSDHFRVKICFGRWQRDEEYGLDTSVYNNVYLEIPWELDTTYYTTHTFAHTIRYLRPIDKLPWKGFIRSRDIEYGSHAFAAGHYYVDLPLKYPWYLLGCRIYDIDADFVADIPHIKLDIDDGRYVLVDDDTDDILTTNTERLPYPIHTYWKKTTLSAGGGGGYLRSYMGRCEEVTAIPYVTGDGDQIELSSLTGQRIELYPVTSAGVAATSNANVSMWGAGYMCCMLIKDWFIQPEHGLVAFNPFPAAEHSEADIDYTTIAVTVEDLRTFLSEVCPPHI